jgi:hypothetical protein
MTKSADVASLLASSRPYLCERDDIVDTADGAARSVNGRAQGHSIKHECWPVPREAQMAKTAAIRKIVPLRMFSVHFQCLSQCRRSLV